MGHLFPPSRSVGHDARYVVGFPGGLVPMEEMQETQVQSLGHEGPLKKRMKTHSSVLARWIPWTEEPGGLQSMWSQESDTTEQLHFYSISSVSVWNKICKTQNMHTPCSLPFKVPRVWLKRQYCHMFSDFQNELKVVYKPRAKCMSMVKML